MDISRGTQSRLTFHPRWEIFPVWSPDGNHIAFGWDKDGPVDIYRKAAGGGVEELLPREALGASAGLVSRRTAPSFRRLGPEDTQ